MNLKKISITGFSVSILFSITLSFFVFSCKHKENGPIGPKIKAATSNFKFEDSLMKISTKKPDFSNGTIVKFGIGLNEEVSWTLKIKSINSSSNFSIDGLSDSVNASWDGASSDIYFFKTGEKCLVELTVLGSNKKITDTITILKEKRYGGKWSSVSKGIYFPTKLRNGAMCIMIDNLDLDVLSNPSDQYNLLSNVNPDLGGDDKPIYSQKNEENPIQGKYCYFINAYDKNSNTYCGSMNTTKLNAIANTIPANVTNDQLYINAYIYGYGSTHPNTSLNFVVNEIDSVVANENNYPQNENYSYNSKIQDAYTYRMAIDWDGWKLVSIPYSLFNATVQTEYIATKGDKIKEASHVSGVQFSIDCYPNSGDYVKLKLDQVTITYGGPFIQ